MNSVVVYGAETQFTVGHAAIWEGASLHTCLAGDHNRGREREAEGGVCWKGTPRAF